MLLLLVVVLAVCHVVEEGEVRSLMDVRCVVKGWCDVVFLFLRLVSSCDVRFFE